jgi:phage shock protein E
MDSNVVLAVLTALAFVFLLFRRRGDINSRDARESVQAGALLVDVRSPAEFAGGHIEGAINVPLQGLATRLEQFGEKQRPIILYCASGVRSSSAAGVLRRAGYAKVDNLGAKSRW